MSYPFPVLGIVGWSGSGKTTLIEALLPRLAACGLRVNVVKHSHHDVELEPPGKDSARFRAAGAQEVLLASPHRWMLARETPDSSASLDQLLLRLSPADLTLVEGFKRDGHPKLEVWRSAVGKPPRWREDPTVRAVAGDTLPEPDAPGWLDLNDPDAVCAWIVDWVRAAASSQLDKKPSNP